MMKKRTAKSKNSTIRPFFIGIGIGLVFLLVFIGIFILVLGKSIQNQTGITPQTAYSILFETGVPLKSSKQRTNLLVLGRGGENHTGSDLTDTILVISVRISDGNIAMVSIPRDTWSPTLQDKVNSAYYYGKQKEQGNGLTFVKTIIEETIGLPIHYVINIDFSGFKHIIDVIGGVDVHVPHGFTDIEFPIEGKEDDLCDGDPLYACRYETISFQEGVQHMDGEEALKYVRSRHAVGDEGTDFARSRRQQEVILALKQKLMRPQTWLQNKNTEKLMASFNTYTETNMTMGELLTVGKSIYDANGQKMKQISLEDQLTQGVSYQYKGKYVLVPVEGWDMLHQYIHSQLD
ncbi:LCP family protein [Patescibacteria group bacterium]